jgi:hypothetical protein
MQGELCFNPAEFVEKFFGKIEPEMLMQEVVSEKPSVHKIEDP